MRILNSFLPALSLVADFELTEVSDQYFVLRDTSQDEERSITRNIDEVLMLAVELGYNPKKHTFLYLNSHNTFNAAIIDRNIRMKALFCFDTNDLICAKQLCMFFVFSAPNS